MESREQSASGPPSDRVLRTTLPPHEMPLVAALGSINSTRPRSRADQTVPGSLQEADPRGSADYQLGAGLYGERAAYCRNTDLKLDWREWSEPDMASSPDKVQSVWIWADHANYFGELVTLSPIPGRARAVGFTDPSN